MLSENVIKGRLKKNAIDSAGHAINFAIELLWLILVAMGGYWTPDEYRWLTRCFTISTYGILSAVHILFSKPLRAECAAIHSKLNGFASWLWNSVKSNDGQSPTNEAIGIPNNQQTTPVPVGQIINIRPIRTHSKVANEQGGNSPVPFSNTSIFLFFAFGLLLKFGCCSLGCKLGFQRQDWTYTQMDGL